MMWVMAPPYDEAALQRLASAVTRRRVELELNKIDVARAAGVQINTYSKVEDAKSVRLTTYGKVEAVLGWATGSCVDILKGAPAATLLEQTESGPVSPVRVEDLAEDAGNAVQNATVAIGDGLSAAQIRKIKQQVVDELLQRWSAPKIDQN